MGLRQAEAASEGGSEASVEVDLSAWPFVRQYAELSGGVSERIGTEARQEAARGEYIADAMARLRQGLISLEEFRLFMQSRDGDELAQVGPLHTRRTLCRLTCSPQRKRPLHIGLLSIHLGACYVRYILQRCARWLTPS